MWSFLWVGEAGYLVAIKICSIKVSSFTKRIREMKN
jgi:hypothetical protein